MVRSPAGAPMSRFLDLRHIFLRQAFVRVPAAVVSAVRGLLPMETRHNRRTRLRAVAAQLVVGIAGLGLVTFGCFQLGFGVGRTAFAYVIVLVLVSLLGSFGGTAVLSIVAATCLNYFFAPPLFELRIDDPDDVVRIAVFLTTSLVVTALTSRLKRTGDEFRREQHQAGSNAAHCAGGLVGTRLDDRWRRSFERSLPHLRRAAGRPAGMACPLAGAEFIPRIGRAPPRLLLPHSCAAVLVPPGISRGAS